MSAPSLGERETEPEERVDERLVRSEAESRGTEPGLVVNPPGLPSPEPVARLGRAVVRRLLPSGSGTGSG